MPFAFELFLDETSAAPVRAVWQELADRRISPYLAGSGSRPHITLAVCEQYYSGTEAKLRAFAEKASSVTVLFSHLGFFMTRQPIVFAAPVVTQELLHLHQRFHGEFGPNLTGEWPLYRPGRWVPHCTLADEIRSDCGGEVLEICQSLPFPMAADLTELGIVEFRPVRLVTSFPLGAAPPCVGG